MENDNYYYYQEPSPRKKKKGLSASAITVIVCCSLIAVLLVTTMVVVGSRSKLEESAGASLPEATQTAQTADSASSDNAYQLETSASNTTSMASDGPYTKAQVVEMAAPSVVGIDITTESGYGWYTSETTSGSGSGIIITEDGYIVTCAHVVDNAKSITVTLNDDASYEAALVGTDNRLDIALLKIDADGLTAATFGDSDMLTVGEDVIAIGNPLGELRGTATYGIISAVSRTVKVEGTSMTLVQTDAAISPGNSGGGLFNSSGKLIGIVNAKVTDSDAEGLGFAIPVNSVVNEINELLNYGYVTGRATLGVTTQNVTLRQSMGAWSYRSSCVQIASVSEGSAAETAGLEVGDCILAVDNATISSNDDLQDAIAAYDVGDTAILIIQRDGQQYEVTVTF